MGFEIRLGAAVLALAFSAGACCQAVGRNVTGDRATISPAAMAPAKTVPNTEVVREIDDTNNGARWLLFLDANHPGGPGRLVLAAGLQSAAHSNEAKGQLARAAELPAIRAGDKIILEEHSATVEGNLEAIALGPAAIGSFFRVRLSIGGKVVRALAMSPGRAVFQSDLEPRP